MSLPRLMFLMHAISTPSPKRVITAESVWPKAANFVSSNIASYSFRMEPSFLAAAIVTLSFVSVFTTLNSTVPALATLPLSAVAPRMTDLSKGAIR